MKRKWRVLIKRISQILPLLLLSLMIVGMTGCLPGMGGGLGGCTSCIPGMSGGTDITGVAAIALIGS